MASVLQASILLATVGTGILCLRGRPRDAIPLIAIVIGCLAYERIVGFFR